MRKFHFGLKHYLFIYSLRSQPFSPSFIPAYIFSLSFTPTTSTFRTIQVK